MRQINHMPPFNYELHKKQNTENGNGHIISQMGNLKESIDTPGNLFTESEQKRLDQLKAMFPEEYDMLINSKAYQDLEPEQKIEVGKKLDEDHLRKFMKETFNRDI